MKKTTYIPLFGFPVVVGITWFATTYLGNRSESSQANTPQAKEPLSAPSDPLGIATVPPNASNPSKTIDESLRIEEQKKAALLRAQQVAAAKVVLIQFRDRIEGVQKLLDERKAEDARWDQEVSALLDNDDGRAVAANQRLVREVRTLLGQRKSYELTVDSTQNSINPLLQTVVVALDVQAFFTPDSFAVGQIARLETITREPTIQNREAREAILRLVEDAKRSRTTAGQGKSARTLRVALDELRTEEVREKLAVVHAQIAKQQAAVAEKWAARKIKLIDRLGRPKTDELEAVFQSVTNKEKYEAPTQALVSVRETLREAFGKLEADQIEAEWFYCWRWSLPESQQVMNKAK